MKIRWEVHPSFNGKKLSEFLRFYAISSKRWASLMGDGNQFQDRIIKKHEILYLTETNDVFDAGDLMQDLVILYEDESFLIVNKRAFQVIYDKDRYDESLQKEVDAYVITKGENKRYLPVHRIDYETSGIVVFAKHTLVLSYMSALFETRNVVKIYDLLCSPALKSMQGILNGCIGKDRHTGKQTVLKTGKQAITQYEVIQTSKNISYVKAHLLTGRKHQIRVHFSHMGHPILGDRLYGGASRNELALHNGYMSFIHPRTLEVFEIVAEAPFQCKF